MTGIVPLRALEGRIAEVERPAASNVLEHERMEAGVEERGRLAEASVLKHGFGGELDRAEVGFAVEPCKRVIDRLLEGHALEVGDVVEGRHRERCFSLKVGDDHAVLFGMTAMPMRAARGP